MRVSSSVARIFTGTVHAESAWLLIIARDEQIVRIVLGIIMSENNWALLPYARQCTMSLRVLFATAFVQQPAP